MSFARSVTDKDLNCMDTSPEDPAQQLTIVSAFMDLSLVYGNNREENRLVRAFYDGKL